MERAPWQNPRILYTLLFVFLSGAAVGALAMKLSAPAPQYRSGVWLKEGEREKFIERYRKDLDLTPEQAREIETILNDFVMYYQTLQAQMDDVRATGRSRILKILNEEQRRKFEKLMGEIQNKPLR